MSFRDEYEVGYIPGNLLSEAEEYARFYSVHYGKWSSNSCHKGNVSLSAVKLKKWLGENSLVFYARLKKDNSLLGYAIAVQNVVGGDKKTIIWVTQFVVHTDYRNRMVGFDLLTFVWGLSDAFAWGLVTANPYAVRALEKATRRRCTPGIVKSHLHELKAFANGNVNYVDDTTAIYVDDDNSIIDTKFYVDHSDVPDKIKNVSNEEVPWLLGELPEGQEWLAFVFNEQPQFNYTKSEINHLLKTSDDITRQAYGKMHMEKHGWAKHTDEEADYIMDKCSLQNGGMVLDIGCGLGRHTIELTRRGLCVIGVDYSIQLIDQAREKARSVGLREEIFQMCDLTSDILPFDSRSFDCAICLYDVIGSYVDEWKNKCILKNMYKLLKDGGMAVISVMNMQLTADIAKNKFVLGESTLPLLNLASSSTMQDTGEVFNSDYYLVDTRENVVYRKEQFSYPGGRSIVSIVRDKRYYMDTISQMCLETGFNIIEASFVKANGWKTTYQYNDKNAKEILLLLQKPFPGSEI